MSFENWVRLASLILVLGVGSKNITAEEKESSRPNIIVVLCDDLGYGDIACFGHPIIQTPNIDQLAKEGVTLTNCYACATNCSPSRAGLMTGRTPHRVGIHNWIPHDSPMHVKEEEITIATLLRQSGYTTCQVGKWHLNGLFNKPGQPQPSDHGFDYWFSTQNNALPTHEDPYNFVRNGKPVGKIEGYAAHIVTKEAIDWLRQKRDKEKPFFMYVCYHEPHEPIKSAQKYKDLYPECKHPTQANHHGNITQMDDAFGQLMQELDNQKLRDSTLVIFTSDNGPAITERHPHGSVGPLRGKKGYVYEGGIRVPGIIRYPGKTKAGTTCKTPISGVDILPTLCEIAHVPVPTDRKLDGTSFTPIFSGEKIERKVPLYWQFNTARGEPKVAMRVGGWKILATLTGNNIKQYSDIRESDQIAMKKAELKSFELYHLDGDIGESIDLAPSKPKRLEQMITQLRKLYCEVRDESPVWPAWESPQIEGKVIEAYYKNQEQKKK